MKVDFVVYETATGKVLRCGTCEETLVSAQASNAGESALQATLPEGQPATVENGALVLL